MAIDVRTPEMAALAQSVEDAVPIQAFDHVEFWVGNAHQAAHYYRHQYGFDIVAYAGPETGVRDRASYALRQGEIVFVMTGGLSPESPVTRHVALHGDGVREIVLRVADPDGAFVHATSRGATQVLEPTTVEGQKGQVRRSAIAVYGDTVLGFLDRSAYHGTFLPRFHKVSDQPSAGPRVGLRAVDHMVANVELGQMDEWARFYADVLGFKQLVHFSDEQISTEFTALMSKVMQNGTGRVKFPINEPAPGKKKSQVDEYLDAYRGPGIQHVALITGDIVATVRELRARGVRFLRVPDSYYDELGDRIGHIQEPMSVIRELGILVDRDDEGYLLQIFTKPLQDRPTVFFEIIQRRGSQGFGLGNFKALFEALEIEQGKRGNL